MKRIALLLTLLAVVMLTSSCTYYFETRANTGDINYRSDHVILGYDETEMIICAIEREGDYGRPVGDEEMVISSAMYMVIPGFKPGKSPVKITYSVNGGKEKVIIPKRVNKRQRWIFTIWGSNDRSLRKITVKITYRDNQMSNTPDRPAQYVDSRSFNIYNCFDSMDPRCEYPFFLHEKP